MTHDGGLVLGGTRSTTPSELLGRLFHADDPAVAATVALSRRCTDAGRPQLTYRALREEAVALGAALTRDGIVPGERVVLLGDSSPDWVVAFFGILAAGAVVVPLDPRLSAAELAPLVADAAPGALLAARDSATALADAAAKAGVDLAVAAIEPDGLTAPGPEGHGDGVAVPARTMQDPAVIVYTSGTTGEPKGVTVSWDNLAYQAWAVEVRQRVPRGSVFVSILPTHHLYELACGLLGPLLAGLRVHYAESLLPAQIVEAIATEKATHLTVVPLFLRAVQRRLDQEAAKATGATRVYLRVAPRVAARLPRRARRAVLAPLHARFGGRLRTFFVGGAPLDPNLARAFDALGFNVCQGYGLSEATPVVAANAAHDNRIGSVGRPVPETEVRIAGDGEIEVRGPGVMLGYWQRPDLTAAAIDADGWLATGDAGRLEDGYLYVTGRMKTVIVLPSGKNVQPEELEEVLERSPLVGDVCAVGVPGADGDEVVVVVTPSEWAREELADAAERADALRREVRDRCGELSAFKRPSRVVVRDEELPKTSTRKVRRREVRALVAANST